MSVAALLSVVLGSASFMTQKTVVSIGLAVAGLACGIAALWLHVTRPK
jgi:hypothetical protein